ncbi:MAG: hypothetical protein QXS32_07690 [Candidatus Nezhaarchaeales archaeon]
MVNMRELEELWKEAKEIIRKEGEVNRFKLAAMLNVPIYSVYLLAKIYAVDDLDVAYYKGTFKWIGPIKEG